MARTKRSKKLDTRSARIKLASEVRHQDPLAPGKYLAYRRPKSGAAGSWLARWYDNETHKDGQERIGTADDFQEADGVTVLTYAQAQAQAHTWFSSREHLALHGDSSLPQDGPLTVAQAIDRYIERNESQGGKSVKDMRQRAELWIKPNLGSIQVAKLTRARVEAWHLSIAESERSPRPKKGATSPKAIGKKAAEPDSAKAINGDSKRKRKSTANRILTVLKAALTCARVQGWVVCAGDAWELVKPFRGVEESRQQYLTPEEQTRLLNSIVDVDFRRLVAGALSTGCRYGELCRVKVMDFDPSGAGSILISEAKGGKPRRVILTSERRAFFLSITAGRPADEYIFRRDKAERRSRKGGGDDLAWTTNDQQRLMHEACRAAGLPEMGFHQLRHSYASALVTAGMPLALLAKLTGHADTRMLERHYAHLATSDLSRALEALAPTLNLPIENIADLSIKRG